MESTTTTTEDDEILGRDGPSGDGLTSLYLIREGRLIRRCEYKRRHLERTVEPAEAITRLRSMATLFRRRVGLCRDQGISPGDFPGRAYACNAMASLIRDRFGA